MLQWRVMRFPEEPVPDDGMTLEFAEAKDGAAGGKAPMSMDEMRFGAAGAGLRKVRGDVMTWVALMLPQIPWVSHIR